MRALALLLLVLFSVACGTDDVIDEGVDFFFPDQFKASISAVRFVENDGRIDVNFRLRNKESFESVDLLLSQIEINITTEDGHVQFNAASLVEAPTSSPLSTHSVFMISKVTTTQLGSDTRDNYFLNVFGVAIPENSASDFAFVISTNEAMAGDIVSFDMRLSLHMDYADASLNDLSEDAVIVDERIIFD